MSFAANKMHTLDLTAVNILMDSSRTDYYMKELVAYIDYRHYMHFGTLLEYHNLGINLKLVWMRLLVFASVRAFALRRELKN